MENKNSKRSLSPFPMMGYFKEQLSVDEKQELLEVIEHYRLSPLPLSNIMSENMINLT